MSGIDGATRIYVIVGDPVAQVRSPAVYNPLIAAAGRNAVLLPWHLAAARFEEGLRGLAAAGNVDGVIVTYPHKQAALALAGAVRPRAAQVGAANALRRAADGGWEADMFDGVGLARALRAAGAPVAGRRTWLVGAGGAGSAIAFALADEGAAAIHVTDIDGGRAAGLAAAVARAAPGCATATHAPALAGIDIVVNASPVGMGGEDDLPFAAGHLPPSLVVADIVSRAGGTPLVRRARGFGCATVEADAMVRHQAQAVLDYFWRTDG